MLEFKQLMEESMNKLRLVEILGNDGCWHKTKFSQIVKGDVYRLFDTDGPLPCIENGMPTVALADAQETDGICGDRKSVV